MTSTLSYPNFLMYCFRLSNILLPSWAATRRISIFAIAFDVRTVAVPFPVYPELIPDILKLGVPFNCI